MSERARMAERLEALAQMNRPAKKHASALLGAARLLRTPTDRRTLEAAASALRHMPPKARAGHLARRLSEMAARIGKERDE